MKLLSPLSNSPNFQQVRDLVHGNHTAWCAGVIGAQKWHLAAGLLADTQRPALIVAPSELKAKEIFADLSYFFRDACCYYPSRDMIFYAADVRSVDITRQRLQVVERLLDGGAPPHATDRQPIIILSAEALLDRLVPASIFAS